MSAEESSYLEGLQHLRISVLIRNEPAKITEGCEIRLSASVHDHGQGSAVTAV